MTRDDIPIFERASSGAGLWIFAGSWASPSSAEGLVVDIARQYT
jgi:hypothetical protein